MDKQKHTPLPWKAKIQRSVRPLKCEVVIDDRHSDEVQIARIAGPFKEHDVKFIVHACNMHYDLVEALEAFMECVRPNNTVAPPMKHLENAHKVLYKAKAYI